MKYIKFGSVAVVFAALLWSLDGLLRRNLYDLPAAVIVFWETLFGFIILLPFIAYSYKAFRKLTKKQWQAIIGVSFLSGAVGTIFYTAALTKIQFIPFSVVVLLQQLQPIFAITAAALLLKEPLSRKFIGLAGLALVAAYFVSFPNLTVELNTGDGTLMAALLAVGAAAAWGTSTAFSKYALKDTSTLHITALRFGFTPIFALLFVVFSGNTAALGSITAEQFKYIIAITFSTGLLALMIYYFGLKRIPASRSTLLELAWPLSAVVIGYLFLNETLVATQALGSLVLLGVIYMIAKDANQLALAKAGKNSQSKA
jgi:drug/metabolite transporter, DME family